MLNFLYDRKESLARGRKESLDCERKAVEVLFVLNILVVARKASVISLQALESSDPKSSSVTSCDFLHSSL